MTDLATSITMTLTFAAGALAWDAYLAVRGHLASGGDFCDGWRVINKYTGGLFALTLLALWWHCFGYMPPSWRGF
jgi:hypothetical protein